MRSADVNDLRRIQLEILDVVAEFCDKNEINYWLDCGTLLGAIRHKGYIPWDDDIDIGMLRPDYDRFMELFNRHNERYQFFCIENNSKFYYAHGKVLDTNTVLYEPDKSGTKISINIDVFVYDNAKDKEDAEKRYAVRDKLRDLDQKRSYKDKPRGNAFRRLVIYIVRFILRILPKNFFIKQMIKNSKKRNSEDTMYVGNFTSYAKIVGEKRWLSSSVLAEFEGKYYKVPVEYDKWLKCFYKDYMQLPPKDKQVSHHAFEAYMEN